MKPGTKVYITKDIRDGGTASGKVGTYEGMFPLTVVFGYGETPDEQSTFAEGEYLYEDYKNSTVVIEAVTFPNGKSIELQEPMPINKVFVEWERGKPRPAPFFAMPFDNPRIRLEDGSVIWGVECWWEEWHEDLTPEDSQKHLDEHIDLLRKIVDAAELHDKNKTKP